MEYEKEDWSQLRDSILRLPKSLQRTAIDDVWSSMTTELIKNYLLAAIEVRNDKRRPPEVRRANLQKILTPILLIQKAYSLRLLGKEKENPYRITNRFNNQSYFPFIADDHINTKEEIDLSKLHYDRKRYFIDPRSFCEEFFDTIHARITLYDDQPEKWEEYYNGIDVTTALRKKLGITPVHNDVPPSIPSIEDQMTFRDCYHRKLPTITQDTIKSHDLLDQLIVTYTIKQALNGDGAARQKLVDLYIWKAIKETSIALKNRELKGFHVHGFNIRDASCEILHLLLGGLNNPESLINCLQSGRRKRNKRSLFPLWAEKFFIWYFAEYLPPYLEYAAQNPESVNPHSVVAMMSPYSLIHAGFRWNHPQYKHARRFLSCCYRPQKDLNLTTWLFAPYPYGTFRLLLQERIDEEAIPNGLILPEINDDSDDDPLSQEDLLDSINFKNRAADEPEEQYFFQSTIDALLKKGNKKTPKKKNLLKRNVQIYRQYKKDKYRQTELAEMHQLTREQINRIIKQIDKEVKKIEKN